MPQSSTRHSRAGLIAGALACFVALAAAATPLRADPIADFYKKANLTIVIGYNVGGGYDSYGRALARHLGKHVPGEPTIIVQNMGGGGSRKATQYIYTVGPQDGSVIGIVSRDIATDQLIGSGRIQTNKLAWIGSISNETSVCATWHTAKAKTWDDFLTIGATMGASSGGADTDTAVALIKNLLGAKVTIVQGYNGGSGINLAMERGEVDGRCGWSWSSVESRNEEWLKDKKINLILQFALEKNAELPNVPLIMDVAKTDEQKKVLRLLMARQAIARPVVASHAIPADRLAALRKAFDETMKDPDFIADAKKVDLDVAPVRGEAIDKILADIRETSPAIIAKAKASLKSQ
jgi:tripartite-type tricarboxylate transporter receptor subunit TctC